MSDSGDKPRPSGPLPRTNRPRPDPGKRRAPRTSEEGTDATTAAQATETAEAAPISGRLTTRSVEVIPAGDAAPPTVRTPNDDAPGSETNASDADADADAQGTMAERPTQLDTGKTAAGEREERHVTPSVSASRLKQVPLLRADGTAAAPAEDGAPASTYVGCVIDGRYRIEGVLGRGGMGVVYRARHEVIDKLFAVKILLPTEDTEVVERFVNEARAATAIGNAHIVDTVDFGALPDGSTYFVMEYLEGQTLARRIKTDGFISVSRSIAMCKQIAEGMSAAHKAGIVHRDLKPENIFLTRRDDHDDFVKLLDFGIAKIESSQNRITRAGTIFGTPHYMSPEQASGAEVDARTDVYAMGVILYEMLSGKVPFEAENPMGLMTQHLYTEPSPLGRLPSPPQPIPSGVDAIVLRCLAKKPDERYESMADFSADLDRVFRGEPPEALAAFLARAERDDDQTLVAAARAEFEARASERPKRWPRFVVGAVVLSALALAIFAIRLAPGTQISPLETSGSAAATSGSAAPVDGEQSVALVFSPIDAEVFRDGHSLGGMPVTVRLASREKATVEIRRDGFYPEPVVLDGSRPVVVVRLTPIPGVQPRIPVPTGEPLEALRRSGDAGALKRFAAYLYGHRDAGAPSHRVDRPVSHVDAGMPRALSPPAPSVPAGPGPTEPVVVTPPPSPAPALPTPAPAPMSPPAAAPTGAGLAAQPPPSVPQAGNTTPATAGSVAQ